MDQKELAKKVKKVLDDAYSHGEGSVKVDGKMYDVANIKYIEFILHRAEAIALRDSEKAAAINAAGG